MSKSITTESNETTRWSRAISTDDKKSKQNRHSLTRNSLISKITNESKTNQSIQENFLNFVILNNSQYADFTKIEEHYKQKLISINAKFNKNRECINKKKKEYSELLDQIGIELKQNYIIADDSYLAIYNEKINKIRYLIKVKEHEFECYKNIYSRVYKENYLMKKRLEQERIYEKKDNEQYEQYNIIKEQKVKILNNQTNILNTVKRIERLSTKKYENEIEQKLNKLKKIDLQVMSLKNEISYKKNEMRVIKANQKNLAHDLNFYTKLNSKIKSELISLRKEIFIEKIKYLKLIEYLKERESTSNENPLRLIILSYNSQQTSYNNYIHKFNVANKEIESLHFMLTQLDNEHLQIKDIIIKENNNFIHRHNNAIEKRKYFTLIKTEQQNIKEQITDKQIQLKHIINLMLKVLQKSHRIIIRKVPKYLQSNISCINQFKDVLHSSYSLFTYDKTLQLYQINLIKENKYKVYLRVLCTCHNTLMLLLSIFFNKISEEYMNQFRFKKKKKIIDFNSKEFYKLYKQQMEGLKNDYLEKSALYVQTQKRYAQRKVCFQNVKENQSSNIIDIKESLNTAGQTFLKFHPRKSINMINKYINIELHNNEDFSNFQKGKDRNSMISLFTEGGKKNNEHDNNRPSHSHLKINKTEDNELSFDSFNYDEEEKNETKKSKKKVNVIKRIAQIQFVSNNRKYNKICSRRNDLRKLELNYFNSRDGSLTNQEFSLIYQKLKSNYKKLSIKRKKNKSESNIHDLYGTRSLPRLHTRRQSVIQNSNIEIKKNNSMSFRM